VILFRSTLALVVAAPLRWGVIAVSPPFHDHFCSFRKCARLVALFGMSLALTAVPSQAQGLDLPKVNIEQDEVNNHIRMSWHSEVGFTYFILHSLDLKDWTYLNVIEPGNGQEKEWAYPMPNPSKFFLRLHLTDRPGDAFTGDFDGDGLSNQAEVALGLNPLKADTDGDGLSDLMEIVSGGDPLVDEQSANSLGLSLYLKE